MRAFLYMATFASALAVDVGLAILIATRRARFGAELRLAVGGIAAHALATVSATVLLYVFVELEARRFGAESLSLLAFNVAGPAMGVMHLGATLGLAMLVFALDRAGRAPAVRPSG